MSDAGFDKNPDSWSEFAPDWDAGFAAFTALFARDAASLAGVRPRARSGSAAGMPRGMRRFEIGCLDFGGARYEGRPGIGTPLSCLWRWKMIGWGTEFWGIKGLTR